MRLRLPQQPVRAQGTRSSSHRLQRTPPSRHNLLHCMSFLWILHPTDIEEIPLISRKTYCLSIPGNLSLLPCRIWSATGSFFCSSNNILPAKTSTENIPKGEHVCSFRLHNPYGPSFASGEFGFRDKPPGSWGGTVGLGSELMGAGSDSVKGGWLLQGQHHPIYVSHHLRTKDRPTHRR